MNHILETIQELEHKAGAPKQAVEKAIEDTGKKAVGCFPIYAPEEVVYAAGMLPVGMWGGQGKGSKSAKYLQGFCCSIMKANTEQALSGTYDCLSGVIVIAYCDTLKCIIEDWKAAVPHLNLLPVVYPQNRKIKAGIEYSKAELKRVGKELEQISGIEITEENLAKAVDLYDQHRKAMQEFVRLAAEHTDVITAKRRHLIIKSGYFMDKNDHLEKIKALNKMLSDRKVEKKQGQKRIILTGLMAEPAGFLELLDENDLAVVADDLAQESRQFRNISEKTTDPWERMANRIAGQDGCSFLYDEKKSRCERLIELKEQYDADAILFCQLKFCDPEEFDYPIIKKKMEEKDIPLLYLEIEQQMDSMEQLRTRIQGFVEMLD